MVQLPSDSTSMLAPRFSRGTGDSYPDLLDFGVSEMFDTNQVAFRFAGANQLIGFCLDRYAIAVLGSLDPKNHQESGERRTCVDDELPCLRVIKDGARCCP